MLKLSRMTDYAVAVLCQMARDGGETLSAGYLARITGLPPPSVAKLLKVLAQGGIVAACRGSHGGYRLARPAEAVSVRDVMAAVEGPVALAACVDGDCDVEASCPARGRWSAANAAVERALAGVTLAEMSQGPVISGGGHA